MITEGQVILFRFPQTDHFIAREYSEAKRRGRLSDGKFKEMRTFFRFQEAKKLQKCGAPPICPPGAAAYFYVRQIQLNTD